MANPARAAQAGGVPILLYHPRPSPARSWNAVEPITPEEKLIVTPHLRERRRSCWQMSDAFMVLPGGLGTFDEFFEVATEAASWARTEAHHRGQCRRLLRSAGRHAAPGSSSRASPQPIITQFYHLARWAGSGAAGAQGKALAHPVDVTHHSLPAYGEVSAHSQDGGVTRCRRVTPSVHRPRTPLPVNGEERRSEIFAPSRCSL